MVLTLSIFGCRVNRTRRIAPSQLPVPPQSASLAQLISKINSQSAAVHTLTALVDLEPSAGSIYSGAIKRYHDVKGFVLVKQPAYIRMALQAPVVRTDIFDMASDGKQFSVYIPSKGKFYVGETSLPEKPGKALENLRPQHLVDAFLLKPIDPLKEPYFIEEVNRQSERDYVIGELGPPKIGPMHLQRKIWINRSGLEISRVQLYGAAGALLEDIRYANYRDSGGVHYPEQITVRRPVEDYSVVITLLRPQFNQSVARSKFVLAKPANAQVVNLNAAAQPGEKHGQ